MRGLIRRWREWREAREEYRASVEEMELHIELETEHNLRRGMSPREARREALRAFGGVDRYAEAARDERPGTRWSEFRTSYLDWKLGARMLAKHPGVSVLGAITLAAAIGFGAGWFEVSMMVFRPELPLEQGDRIVRIEYASAATLHPERRMMHELAEWRDGLATVEQIGAHRTVTRNLAVPGATPAVVRVAEMSASGFEVARVPPLLGRPLVAADEEPGGADVVVIGYDAWRRHFDGDPDVVGREVRLGRARATVVGVMPEGYGFPFDHQFWMPLRAVPAAPLEGEPIAVFGRLRPGETMESAAAELAAWGARMARASPETHGRLRLRVVPFAAPRETASVREEAVALHLAAWLILLAACANVAALMFARTAMRQGEIVVRSALGASRARVLGQLFTEALVLTSLAAAVGLLGVKVVFAYLIERMREDGEAVPFWWESNIEPATLLYTALLAVVGAAVVGLLPALRATGRDARAGLAQIGSGGTTLRFGGVWSAIIVLQVAFSVVCLPFGLVALQEALMDSRRRAAFPADAYLTFRPIFEPEGAAGGDAAARTDAVLAELSRQLKADPEVAGVAAASALPGTSHPLSRIEAQRGSEPPFLVDAVTEGDRVRHGAVGPGYFELFDAPVLAGRDFEPGDVGRADGVAVINESLARSLGGNPIGVRLRFAASGEAEAGRWHEVVGVVRDFGLTPTGRGEADYMWTPVSAAEAGSVVLRVNGDMAAVAERLRTVAMRVEPSLRLHDVASLRELFRRQDVSMMRATLAGLAVVLLAIVLSAASLYALMSVAVALRTREIGIRVAIGASPRAVLTALFRRAAMQVGIGIFAGNFVVVLLLHAMIEEVQPRIVAPPLLIGSAVMLLVGLAASFVPARRALRVQPTEALKEAR